MGELEDASVREQPKSDWWQWVLYFTPLVLAVLLVIAATIAWLGVGSLPWAVGLTIGAAVSIVIFWFFY